MKRRSFLKTVGGTAAGTALGVQPLAGGRQAAGAEEQQVAGLPRRALGRTDLKVSMAGFPGCRST